MKYAYTTALLAGLAAASPVATGITKRQFFGSSSTEDDLESGDCGDIIFIFARGSTETGNMGRSVGPPTCSGLKTEFGESSVICQGVGGAYRASIGTNALPRGTTSGAIDEAIGLFELADSQCPDSIIVAGGYSQGAAVMNGAVEDLDASIQEKVAGVVLYGSTRNAQTGGHIPNFPEEKSLTICAATDGVCGGALVVTAGHLSYQDDVPDAVNYLAERIEAAGAGSGTANDSDLEQVAEEEGGDFGGLSPGTSLGGDDDAGETGSSFSFFGSS